MAEVEHWFGQNVRRLREKAGVTQAELASVMGSRGYEMHQVTVGKIETARRPTRVGEVAALASIFDVDVNALFQPSEPCEQCHDRPPRGYTWQRLWEVFMTAWLSIFGPATAAVALVATVALWHPVRARLADRKNKR